MADINSTYKLLVRDLRLLVQVGIHQHEKDSPQELIINLEMEAVMPAPTSTIEDILCYETIINDFRTTIAKHEPFLLLEHLANTLTDTLRKYDKLKKFRLRLEKPNIISGAKSVGIEINYPPPKAQ